MRKGLCKIVIGLAAALTGAAAFVQAYPDRPIKLIVGIGAGSSTDAISRLIGRKLSDRLSQPVVVENRPGAGGTLGAEAGAKAPTVAELIARAKNKPQSVSYGSAGIGSNAHLASEVFAQIAGVEFLHVPYKSSVAGMTDLLGGRSISSSMPWPPCSRSSRARQPRGWPSSAWSLSP